MNDFATGEPACFCSDHGIDDIFCYTEIHSRLSFFHTPQKFYDIIPEHGIRIFYICRPPGLMPKESQLESAGDLHK